MGLGGRHVYQREEVCPSVTLNRVYEINTNDRVNIRMQQLSLFFFVCFQQFCHFNGVRVGFFRGDVKLLLEDIQELK